MKKEILYLLEYLSKSDKKEEAALYASIVVALENALLHAPSKYTQDKLQALMHHAGYTVPHTFEEAVKLLDMTVQEALPQELLAFRQTIFHTLLNTNFPKKKNFLEHSLVLFESQLEPAEKSIYHTLSAYVIGLNRGLSLFYLLGKTSTPETLMLFSHTLHVSLLAFIFNEEERGFLSEGLTQLLGVYLSLYGKYLYEKN